MEKFKNLSIADLKAIYDMNSMAQERYRKDLTFDSEMYNYHQAIRGEVAQEIYTRTQLIYPVPGTKNPMARHVLIETKSSCSHITLGDGYILDYIEDKQAIFYPVNSGNIHVILLRDTDD